MRITKKDRSINWWLRKAVVNHGQNLRDLKRVEKLEEMVDSLPYQGYNERSSKQKQLCEALFKAKCKLPSRLKP